MALNRIALLLAGAFSFEIILVLVGLAIEAMRILPLNTNLGLKEAKDIADALEKFAKGG